MARGFDEDDVYMFIPSPRDPDDLVLGISRLIRSSVNVHMTIDLGLVAGSTIAGIVSC